MGALPKFERRGGLYLPRRNLSKPEIVRAGRGSSGNPTWAGEYHPPPQWSSRESGDSGFVYANTKSIQLDGSTQWVDWGYVAAFDYGEFDAFTWLVRFRADTGTNFGALVAPVHSNAPTGYRGYHLVHGNESTNVTNYSDLFSDAGDTSALYFTREHGTQGVARGSFGQMGFAKGSGGANLADIAGYVNGAGITRTGTKDTFNSNPSTEQLESGEDFLVGIGYQGGGNIFKGYINEMWGWSRALSGAEVSSAYNGGTTFDISSDPTLSVGLVSGCLFGDHPNDDDTGAAVVYDFIRGAYGDLIGGCLFASVA